MTSTSTRAPARVPLTTIARQWGRIGCIGFGGPPAHIALLRELCVEREGWLSAAEFEDGIAATNLLPGPASTQLAIYTAWRLRAGAGALVGGACFIVPGLIIILGLAALFLAGHPPLWVQGAAAGAGSAVAAVALNAATDLAPPSWRRLRTARVGQNSQTGQTVSARAARARWVAYALAGGAAAALIGPWLVLVLVAAGLTEVLTRTRRTLHKQAGARPSLLPIPASAPTAAALATGGLGALAWVAFKVGALSYGGGFVIIPLMQHDAVDHYHWLTTGQFLSAVALGQITPGPVVQTVAVVGYAAAGVGGGLLAAAVAFAPSFAFVLGGARHFDRLRANAAIRAFLSGAGPAVIGAIAGSAIPLALALRHPWQFALLGLAALWLIGAHRGVVGTLLIAGVLGTTAALAGLPVG